MAWRVRYDASNRKKGCGAAILLCFRRVNSCISRLQFMTYWMLILVFAVKYLTYVRYMVVYGRKGNLLVEFIITLITDSNFHMFLSFTVSVTTSW
jgi:hypothetical protein